MSWIEELPVEVTVCDADGILLALNEAAAGLFAPEGGRDLIGTQLLDCHPEEARRKLEHMMAAPASNAYLSTEGGATRFFFQSPWRRDGQPVGWVELSFEVPEELPHFVRG